MLLVIGGVGDGELFDRRLICFDELVVFADVYFMGWWLRGEGLVDGGNEGG